MPEYRRFIAYFYEYIAGKKQKNAGFAKVELRNGMWRILFRLNTETEPLRPVQAYGFVREQGWQLGLYMGSMRPGMVRMEEWAYRADVPVWQEKYGFASLAGIWIQSEDGRRYVTVWDDEPVFADRFVLALPGEAVNTENKEGPEQIAGREKESAYGKSEEEKGAVEEDSSERRIQAERNSGDSARKESLDEHAQTEGDSVNPVREDGVDGRAQAEKDNVDSVENLEKNGSEWQTHVAGEMQAAEVSEIWEEKESRDSNVDDDTDHLEEPHAQAESDAYQPSEQEQALAMLFANRPALEPFSDTEFRECVQLRPCDLVRLQQANCRVGRNTFLQHGFYQYHHLLLAKDQEGRCILGVPGVVNAQERYMAGMFSFDRFKPANGYDRGRQFGYWCKEI